MHIQLRSRNGKVSERQRAYIEEKLGKLERYLDGIGDVVVELSRVQQRSAGEVHIVQATLQTAQGTILRAEERDSDVFAAIDALHDSLQRQITRYKDRHYRRGKIRRQGGEVVAVDSLGAEEHNAAEAPQIVRTKTFAYKPMYSDEAIEQMELLGHSFFVFTDAETNTVNVVYRRRDGNYGLIVPETS
ncbi:ribosome hibernation-promoting factor, HPF/YfiA family [Kallotenue papyrolyticum]|uniref:ribosome hibernation-promoting factor, HPF/YfiA family n=1 Tax=Kallotenue papyrolyticum TaxID=1325125 RepID=UPI000478622B|nr:ribosome-associated translation inhibitor RaiA [Kallotenue papyrolyticum]